MFWFVCFPYSLGSTPPLFQRLDGLRFTVKLFVEIEQYFASVHQFPANGTNDPNKFYFGLIFRFSSESIWYPKRCWIKPQTESRPFSWWFYDLDYVGWIWFFKITTCDLRKGKRKAYQVFTFLGAIKEVNTLSDRAMPTSMQAWIWNFLLLDEITGLMVYSRVW